MNRCNVGCQEREKKREEWVKSVPTQSSAFYKDPKMADINIIRNAS